MTFQDTFITITHTFTQTELIICNKLKYQNTNKTISRKVCDTSSYSVMLLKFETTLAVKTVKINLILQ